MAIPSSVRPSVIRWYRDVNQAKIVRSSPSDSRIILVFGEDHLEIRTESPRVKSVRREKLRVKL